MTDSKETVQTASDKTGGKAKRGKPVLPPKPAKKDIIPLLEAYVKAENKVVAAREAFEAARAEQSEAVERIHALTGHREVSFKGRRFGRPMKKGDTFFFMGPSAETLEL